MRPSIATRARCAPSECSMARQARRMGSLTCTNIRSSIAFAAAVLDIAALHAMAARREHNSEASRTAASCLRRRVHADLEFWFQSLQNWQSEFLSLVAMVVLGSSCASAARRSRSRWTPRIATPARSRVRDCAQASPSSGHITRRADPDDEQPEDVEDERRRESSSGSG